MKSLLAGLALTTADQGRHALNGPTMGTRWSALFHTGRGFLGHGDDGAGGERGG